jgi:hypothetical protein
MSNLTAAQTEIIRRHPQRTELYLSIYQPKTLVQFQITGTYSSGEIELTYINVVTGSYTGVPANVSALIGTTQGASNVATLRVRSITATDVTFAENEIVWQNGQWVTIIDQVDVQAIYPRIIQDPNDDENVIFYKDYDIPYTNQNTIYGSFPCAGPHRAGNLATGTHSVFYSATGTYNVKGDSLTYSWFFEGATVTGSTALTPGLIHYKNPGHFRTRLLVTSSSGATDTTYRYVSIYPEGGNGLVWELSGFDGSRSESGYTVSLRVMAGMGFDVRPNALVVIYADDYYGADKISLGGNAIGNSSIVFVGYVISDSIKFTYDQSTIEFQVGSISLLMKETEGFSVSCESKAVATTWYELNEMTVAKAMYHYLRWHSTVLNVCDFQYTNQDRLVQYFDADRESLFDSIDNFMRNGLMGELVADRQGKLWAEISYFGLENPFSSANLKAGMTIQKQDWMGEPVITERRNSEASFVELGGIIYYGVSTNEFEACLTNAPGLAPLYHGKSDRQEGLILTSQAQINQVAGNLLASRNSPFPVVDMSLGGNYRNLDIAPQEKNVLVISSNDTIRGVSLQNLYYRVEGMSWRYDSVAGIFNPDVQLQQMVTGTRGVTITIPDVPVDTGFSYPGLSLPPLFDFNATIPTPTETSTTVILKDNVGGLVFSDNFDGTPVWQNMNGGLSAAQYQDITKIFVTPNGSVWVVGDAAGLDANQFVAYAPSVGAPFFVVIDQAWLTAAYPVVTGGVRRVFAIGLNPNQPEQVAFLAGYDNGGGYTSHIWIGNHLGFTQGAVSTNNRAIVHCDLTYGGDKWRATPQNNAGTDANFTRYTANGSAIDLHTPSIGNSLRGQAVAGDSETFNIFDPIGNTFFKRTEDNGNTFSASISFTYGGHLNGMALAEDGLYGMAQASVSGKTKTTNGEDFTSPIPTLPPGAYGYAYMGGEGGASKWIAARGAIRSSNNFGGAWFNKEGNILTLIAVPSIEFIYPVR